MENYDGVLKIDGGWATRKSTTPVVEPCRRVGDGGTHRGGPAPTAQRRHEDELAAVSPRTAASGRTFLIGGSARGGCVSVRTCTGRDLRSVPLLPRAAPDRGETGTLGRRGANRTSEV